MASPSSSSTSSKHNQPGWKTSETWNKKKYAAINDYINTYLAANLIRPQLNKPPPQFCQQTSDSDTPSLNRSEKRHRSRTRNRTEAEKINELAKEMDKMLSKAKSKRQTNDLLQLFKNTLNNFIVPEHPMDNVTNSHVKHNANLKHEKQMPLPSSASIYHKHYRHNRQNKSEGLNESHPSEQDLFSDHETSVTMTTTTTRCEIKDPSRSMIESSKTNILHRCYGKQSVKALPQVYKSRKKNNGYVTSCQRPPMIKMKSQKSPKQQLTKIPNQQMRTIYENEQFDKTKKLIAENSDDTDNDDINDNNSLSISSIGTEKQSTIEMRVNNETVMTDRNRKLSKDFIISKTMDNRVQTSKLALFAEKNEQEINKKINKETAMDISEGQDNSIVQRLTSFWNKKLNTNEQTKSMTDQSSINSSLTSIFEEGGQKGDGNDNQDTKNKLSITDLKLEEDKECFKKTTTKKFELEKDRGDVKFPESKIESEEDIPTVNDTYNKKIINTKKETNVLHNDTGLPKLKMGLMDELLKVLQNKDDTVSQSKNINYNDNKIEKKISDISHHDAVNSEEKLNCLTENDSQNSETLKDTGDEPSDYEEGNYDDNVEQFDEETLEAVEKCLLDSIVIDNVTKNYDDDYIKQQYKQNNNESFTENNEDSYESNITNFNQHTAVITNVNSIIINLKKLIHTIESIPDELKCVDMNLDSLPIPDKIKRKISTLIVTPDNETNIDKRLSPVQSVDTMDINNQLFRRSSSGKLIGYTKREGYTYTLCFPKLLTLPIIEHVKKPFHKILLPKRNECLKFNNMAISIRNITDLSSHGDVNSCMNDKNNEEETEEEKKVMIKNDSLLRSDIFKENTERVDKRIAEITKLETRTTQSSIFFVTPPTSSTLTALKSLNDSNDNLHTGPRKTIVFTPSKITTTVFPAENVNNKSRVKFEENIYIESNSISNKNSFEGLSDRTSGVSCTESNTNEQDEFNLFNECNINNTDENNDSFQVENDTFYKGNRINLEENRPPSPSDLNSLNRRYNNMRRRRRFQNHTDDDSNGILAGGSGDSMQNCGDVSTPIPCHHTSSMSVMVSNSVNDTNSQPDINMVESESNLSRLRLNGHCATITRPQPVQDSDNFSTCGVIQEEGSDEQLSDIDDCVMIEQHNNKKENIKGSYDTVSSSTISSQNTNMPRTSEQDVVLSQDCEIECNGSDKRQGSEKRCDNQFTYQNLKNIRHEESLSLLSRNLTNSHEQDKIVSQNHNIERKESDERQLNDKDSENKFSFHNLDVTVEDEAITKEADELLTLHSDEKEQTSYTSQDIYLANYSNTSLLQQNIIAYNGSNNSDNSSNDISDQDNDYNNNNNKNIDNNSYDNITKNDFHQNYHTLYFETEISKDAENAIANKLIKNNSKTDLEILFENDPFLKTEFSKIVDITSLSDKEKQLIADCINLMNRNNYENQPPQLLKTSINDVSLKLCLNALWNKSSQIMGTQIKIAKKSLIPYESDTVLYQRCIRKLMKACYTLFISLILVFVIQKHFFGILLPIRFPW